MTLNEFRKATMEMDGDLPVKMQVTIGDSHVVDTDVENVCTVCDDPDCEDAFIRITS